MCFDVNILIPGSFASASTLGRIYSGGHPSSGIGSFSAFLSLLAAQQCQMYGFLTARPERPPLVPISMGFFGSSAAGFPRNGLQGASLTCPSPHAWGHQWHILWVKFFCGNLGVPDTILSVSRPDGALGDLLSSWYSLPTLVGAPNPSLIFSLVHLWGRGRT